MKQFTLFLVIIVLADFTFGLPVTKVEEKKEEEKEEKHEELGDDIEVKDQRNSVYHGILLVLRIINVSSVLISCALQKIEKIILRNYSWQYFWCVGCCVIGSKCPFDYSDKEIIQWDSVFLLFHS